jgi:hypothetical protein
VGVGRETVVAVGRDAVMFLARLLRRVHVDDGRVEVAQVVEKLVVDLSGDGVPLLDRPAWVYRDVDLRP